MQREQYNEYSQQDRYFSTAAEKIFPSYCYVNDFFTVMFLSWCFIINKTSHCLNMHKLEMDSYEYYSMISVYSVSSDALGG